MKILLYLIIFSSFIFTDTASVKENVYKKSLSSSNNVCPNPDNIDAKHNISKEVIFSLLKGSANRIYRIERGLNDLDPDQLEPLKSPIDDVACTKINEFVDTWIELKPKEKLSYFKIDTTYFMVIWHDGYKLGFTPMYVFNSQFEPISIGAY